MKKDITDPVKAVESLIGQVILGFEINEDETVTISTNRGFLLIDYVECDIYIEVKEV
jgi:hypothetical protein